MIDVAVIGGGIVGMAVARALAKQGREPVVLEAEPALAMHQTGRNSGVIHSGIYYTPGSLKAALCTDGREKMFRFCEEEGVAVERCGKVIVATEEAEIAALDVLLERARKNGLHGVRRIGPAELRSIEPHVTGGRAALFVPETGIVAFADVLSAMARSLDVRLDSRVIAAHRDRDTFVLETPRSTLRARFIVNCAGLHADRVARLFDVEPAVSILPFRGEYWDLVPSRRHLCRHLIYPVPDPRFPFLGVHLTRATNGAVEAGPNAVIALAREGYSWRDISLRDLAETVRFPGFWRLLARHRRTAAREVHRSLSKLAFVRSIQKLVPDIESRDLEPGRSGVRAQAVGRDGSLVDDFRIEVRPGMVHVLNAPSPAATASLAIGERIATSVTSATSPHPACRL